MMEREDWSLRPPTVWQRLRHYFLTGFFALLPVAITLYVADRILEFFNGIAGLPKIPGLGFVATVVFITLFGVLVENIVGQGLVQLLEWVFRRMPILRGIYDASKQIVKTFFDVSGREGAFKRVVLAPFGGGPGRAIGFVVRDDFDDGRVGVFIPLSPPTSGFFITYRAEDLETTDWSVEDAMRMVLSGGTLGHRHDPHPAGAAEDDPRASDGSGVRMGREGARP
jgi:uncharacterized membrane protein